MRHFTAILLAGSVTAALIPAVQAATPAPAKPAKTAAFQTPRNSDGTPDLNGAWTNATITPLERPAQYGERLVLTPQETAQLEGVRADQVKLGNRNTDPNSVYDPKAPCDVRGFSEAGCGYNAGWTDPGTLVMRVGGQPRTSFLTSPANGRIPARLATAPRPPAQGTGDESGAGRERAGINDNPEGRSPPERCLFSFGNISGPVMTPSLYNNNYQIVQSKDYVAINIEMVHDVRMVRLNAKHRTDGLRPYFGDSIGWYEGDALVVETTGYHPMQNFRGSDANLKVTERFTRNGPNSMLYQFTVNDPTVWAADWGGEYEFKRGEGVYEYACHEGNYGLMNILAGARDEEQRKQASVAQGGKP
ncbi:hypothetical protein BH11PSE2_BH11PSE2_10160 [soil metagenome]